MHTIQDIFSYSLLNFFMRKVLKSNTLTAFKAYEVYKIFYYLKYNPNFTKKQ